MSWSDVDALSEPRSAGISSGAFLKSAAQSFDGYLLVVSTGEASLPLVYESEAFPDAVDAASLGLTRELVARRSLEATLNGTLCLCVYAPLQGSDSILIYAKPLASLLLNCALNVLIVGVTSIIILGTLIYYLFDVFGAIWSDKLTKHQAQLYHPRQLRRRVITAGLTGALVIFLFASIFQTLDAMQEESIVGAQSFSRFYEQLRQTMVDRIAFDKQQEAERYILQGNHIAAIIAHDPSAGSREKLRDCADRLDIDYIMLFDADGRQRSCSADYTGFTLDSGLGKNSQDFRRLLMGVPSIVHDASTDSITGRTLRFIGVRVPIPTEPEEVSYGALVMAIQPWHSEGSDEDAIRSLMVTESNDLLICYADSETGTILYSSDPSMAGNTVAACGLPDECLVDGYMDFALVRRRHVFINTVRQKNMDFFYIIRSGLLFGNLLQACLACTLAYLLVSCIIIAICLRKYDESTFTARVGSVDALLEDGSKNNTEESEQKKMHSLSELLVGRRKNKPRWKERTPEDRVHTLLMVDIVLLSLLSTAFCLKDGGAGFGSTTLLRFLIYGDWSRGFNLFSLCSIVVVLITGLFLIMLGNGLLSLIAGFTGKGGETVCRLLYSLVNYVVILGMLYYMFEYLGLPMSTYIASLSVISLALSLGARDMVTDILAGLLIVFEGQFRVGDAVEIDGVKGTVLEIGVRSTRLLVAGTDIKYITNSSIRSIVNKSKRDAICKMKLIIVTEQTLTQVEAFFNRELPKIGRLNDAIIAGPSLWGLDVLSSAGGNRSERIYKVNIITVCAPRDAGSVDAFVCREIYLLCEREKIMLMQEDVFLKMGSE